MTRQMDALQRIARHFAAAQGHVMPDAPTARATFDVERARRAAAWYVEASTYDSVTPDKVHRMTWRHLGDQIDAQYAALKLAGFVHKVVEVDPFADAGELHWLLSVSWTLPTLRTDPGSHPAWSDAQNDRFRFVHDLLGHVAHGNDFSAQGEDAAYQAHAATLPRDTWSALACETRAQNGVLNYGPRPGTFARQIVALTPEWLYLP